MKSLLLVLPLLLASLGLAGQVTLIDGNAHRVAIYVTSDTMTPKAYINPGLFSMELIDAQQHNRLLESVKDLSACLEKMTGVAVPIYTRQPEKGDAALPIFIGAMADPVFGKFTMKTEFQQGWRLAVAAKGIGMQGESPEAISYAVYELLDQLGCRWYMPGELGEVIPQHATISLPAMDLQRAPQVVTRSVVYGDDAFKRRNRLGGFPYSAGHALEGYLTKEQLEQHPDWQAEIGGKRGLYKNEVGYRVCWANPEVAAAVADALVARLQKNYLPVISLSPDDGANFCECAKCRALDTGDRDPTMNCISVTDRYVHFCNQIAERVTQKFPRVKFGFLAYVQYTRPPVREKLHPSLIPQLAPITYCRAHTYLDPNCPSRPRIKPLLEGWGKVTKNLAMYEYSFHLAEVSAPFPTIKRNVDELPIQFKSGVTMWTPETLTNFESVLPGLYLGIRMSWDPKADPRKILAEFYPTFYGAAAARMKDYWEYIDDCWAKSPEHAGAGFDYARRFTAARLEAMRAKMDAALAACRTPQETRRVQLQNDSLRQFELFMALRRNFVAGRFGKLEAGSQQWMDGNVRLGNAWKENSTFSLTTWAPQTLTNIYFKAFYLAAYADADRISRESLLLTAPLASWRYAADLDARAEARGWQRVDFDDAAWKITDPGVDTWADLGLLDYGGAVCYRTRVTAPDLPAGKKVFLWISSTDGQVKVFLNGQHVPYVGGAATAEGYCQPFSFDVTAQWKPNAENQVTIIGTHTFLNELGTGGLLGPVLFYREQ